MENLNYKIFAILLIMSLTTACSKKSGGDDEATPDKENNDNGDNTDPSGTGLNVTGSLALSETVTHVYAMSPSGYARKLEAVSTDGSFSMSLDTGKPYTFVLLNSEGKGDGMVVGRFNSQTLDSLAATEAGTLALDTLSMPQGATLTEGGYPSVSSSKGHAELIEAMGLSESSAEFLGEKDNVLGRYSNPDIDNNGVIDSEQNVDFVLDFHNRFGTKIAGNDVSMNDIKNKFYPENVSFQYQGSGIVLEVEKGYFSAVPTGYSYTFSEEVVLEEETIAAGTPVAESFTVDPNYSRYQFFLQVSMPPEGDYLIEVGESKFTFNDVRVSDFSGGTGFLMPFIKINVDSNEKITGIDWKWMKLNSSNLWEQASTQEIALIVKIESGYVSLKVDGMNAGKELAFSFTEAAAGTTSIADARATGFDESEKSNITFDRVLENPGLSYDDKLGMRFFQSLSWN